MIANGKLYEESRMPRLKNPKKIPAFPAMTRSSVDDLLPVL
jgi:hypothetical protein